MLLTGSGFLEHLFRCRYPIRSSAVSRGCPPVGSHVPHCQAASEGAPLLPSHRPFSSWSHPPGSKETHPHYDILSSDTHSLGTSRKGQEIGGGGSGSLPFVLWLSLSLPCRRVDGSPGLNGHGVTGSVRRRSGAAARVGCPGCRKWVSLGPGTLQFLCASSGARTSAGDAGED